MRKIVEYQGQTYNYFQHYSSAGSDLGKSSFSLGAGLYEILVASMTSIKPTGSHLGVTNAEVRLSVVDEAGLEMELEMANGFLAIHHPVTLRNQIVLGPGKITGWRMDYLNVPTRFQVLYRRLIE